MTDKTDIRPAATVILTRKGAAGPEVLMGQRGAGAAFMPSKFVFPGGAVDPGDAAVPVAAPVGAITAARLAQGTDAALAHALSVAAIRELWEETGLPMGRPGAWPSTVPDDWRGFADFGMVPDASALTFVFRAITPPGRTRRFDARFFLADAGSLAANPDDFSRASDELSHLHWLPLTETRRLDLPFITSVVLAEVAEVLARGGLPPSVAFFDNSGPDPTFRRIA
ncbi:MAG: NUDIX hydrolase [Paracoccaceae bacterium]|nr:NUDIX hydrolase [Paracoccaceae bacterium]